MGMECKSRRTFLNLFRIFSCATCEHRKEDEFFLIGNTNISIYHLFWDCPGVEIAKEELYFFSKKLKTLLLEAVIHQEEILLLFFENFNLEKNFDLLEQLLAFRLSLQIIAG